jgi:predicted transport protein
MSDIKLFALSEDAVAERQGHSVAVEKSLQTLMERYLEGFIGVRFLASEYDTGPIHRGRVDTLGLDENGCPVIIEYKRATNQNVVSQGLFYLDWLMDHRGDFFKLVQDKLGQEQAEKVDWSAPRLICIAGDFTRYDEHAVKQINRSIDLVRYRRYGDDLLLLDLVTSIAAKESGTPPPATPAAPKAAGGDKTFSEFLSQSGQDVVDRYEALKAFLMSLGDDVNTKELKLYMAFRRLRNFVCVVILPQKKEIVVYAKLDPDTIALEPGFTRDVRKVGHWATGDLEITIKSDEDLERAKPLIVKCYEQS